MPYPNNHACHLRDTSDFKDGSIRSWSSTISGKPVTHRGGKLKSNDKFVIQSTLFPVEHWTSAQAKSKCTGRFEPAKKNN